MIVIRSFAAGEWIFHSPVFCYTGWAHLILGGVHFSIVGCKNGVQHFLEWGAKNTEMGCTVNRVGCNRFS